MRDTVLAARASEEKVEMPAGTCSYLEEHATLAAEASILDRAEEAAAQGTAETTLLIADACRYLEGRFLVHVRKDDAVHLDMAARDHREPEGKHDEPEVTVLTVRLATLRDALEREEQAPALAERVRTLVHDLAILVKTHLGTRSA